MAPSRRSFFKALVAGLLGTGAVGHSAAGRAAVAPRRLRRIGLQLYTVRAEMARDLEATLAAVAEIGYREVEFAGYFGRSPEQIRGLLERYGLASPSTHVAFERTAANWTAALDEAASIGHRFLTVPSIPGSERRTLDDWKRVAERFNRAAAAARDAGLGFAYHNHAFEFEPLEGRVPFDVLLAETDPDLVGIQLDVFWITRAGHDPLAYFERHPGRFWMLHLKDSAGPPDHRMVDPGRGVIDFAAILAAAPAAGVRHAFVEHDQPEDPMATARAGYEYFAALQGRG